MNFTNRHSFDKNDNNGIFACSLSALLSKVGIFPRHWTLPSIPRRQLQHACLFNPADPVAGTWRKPMCLLMGSGPARHCLILGYTSSTMQSRSVLKQLSGFNCCLLQDDVPQDPCSSSCMTQGKWQRSSWFLAQLYGAYYVLFRPWPLALGHTSTFPRWRVTWKPGNPALCTAVFASLAAYQNSCKVFCKVICCPASDFIWPEQMQVASMPQPQAAA